MERELEIAFPFYEKGMEMEFSNRKGNLMLLFPGMAGNRNYKKKNRLNSRFDSN